MKGNGVVKQAGEPLEAPFAISVKEAADAPMWPLHAAPWLQAERGPAIPQETGLAIERHNRFAMPEFMALENALPDRPAMIDSPSAVRTSVAIRLPRSGLAPLGWDARAICRGQGDA